MHDPQRTTLDWDDVRFFTVLARHRSVTSAARALGAPPDLVRTRLANLEAALGYPLFERGSGRWELSRAGAAALAEAAQMEMAACSLMQKVPLGGL